MAGSTTITLRGRVGTDLRMHTTRNGQVTVRFRLAVPQWRVRDDGTFEDQDTRWYTVRAWDRLAQNALASIGKGQTVIVVGRPSVSVWKDEQGEARGELVITAQTIAHDLGFGYSRFARTGALSSAQPGGTSSDEGDSGATGSTADRPGQDGRPEGSGADLPAGPGREGTVGGGAVERGTLVGHAVEGGAVEGGAVDGDVVDGGAVGAGAVRGDSEEDVVDGSEQESVPAYA